MITNMLQNTILGIQSLETIHDKTDKTDKKIKQIKIISVKMVTYTFQTKHCIILKILEKTCLNLQKHKLVII